MKKYINNPTPQHTNYGTYTPLFFERGIRYDKWKSKDRDYDETEAVLCTGDTDLSPVRTGSPTVTEREKCHCCFAGYAHTVELCNRNNNI